MLKFFENMELIRKPFNKCYLIFLAIDQGSRCHLITWTYWAGAEGPCNFMEPPGFNSKNENVLLEPLLKEVFSKAVFCCMPNECRQMVLFTNLGGVTPSPPL